MTKNEEYYMLLVRQYFESQGMNPILSSINIKSKRFQKELFMWLKERSKIGEKYVDFLFYLGKDITNLETAEIEKGKYDSIVRPYETTVITPYYYPDEKNNKEILRYAFFPDFNTPGLLKLDNQQNLQEIKESPSYIQQYITENPYRRTDLFGIEDLHNGGNFDILVGVFGDIQDRDKEKKIKLLKELRDKIIDDEIKVEFDCDRNQYFAAVVSNRKLKKYVKTKIR